MKQPETYVRCENCNRMIRQVSPPTAEQYKQGLIHIEEGSSLLLPKATVAANHKTGISDSHARDIGGYYCDYRCLVARIEHALEVGGTK